MKKIQPTQKIIGESFFGKLPKDPMLLETDFARLDRSIIWQLNNFFWKYCNLWEKIYGENFEASLPSGMSESHKPEFIISSVERFLTKLYTLQKQNRLPHVIYVYEQGPGLGFFAKGFLDELKKRDKEIYKKILYILSDSSLELLTNCVEKLQDHKKHIKIYTQEAFEHQHIYDGKILFARNSNVWDGLPCRYIQRRQSGLGEVYVRAISDEKFKDLILDIQKNGLDQALLKNTKIWKEFFRSIKLQKRTIPLSTLDIKQDFYLEQIQDRLYDGISKNILFAHALIANLLFLQKLINWNLEGYIEIVDIITSKPRRIYPKKYDGSIGYIIDKEIIALLCKTMNKNYSLKQIRKLNTLLTITNSKHSLKEMVKNASLEIFPAKNLLKDIQSVEKNTSIAVTCTSKLGVMHTITNTITLRENGYNAYPHIPARLIRDEKELHSIARLLAEKNIEDIFVAAGNPQEPIGNYESAIELLHAMKNIIFHFGKVGIAGYPEGHPYVSDEKLLDALREKQEFAKKNNIEMKVITQLCFDANNIIKWSIDMKKKGITLPIVIGVPGPCNGIKLLEFAIKCGVGNSLQFLQNKKHLGKEIGSHLAFEYHPDRLLQEITHHPEFTKSNIVGVHFYTFNNLSRFALWQKNFLDSLSVAND